MFKFRPDQYLALVLLSLVFLLPTQQATSEIEVLPPVELSQINPIPVLDDDQQSAAFAATLSAQSIIAIDVDTASILLEKNSHQKVAPASTTKLMTALVSQEIFNLDQVIAVKNIPSNLGHTIGFATGQEFLVKEMLTALLVNSGNDAAEVLAQNHPQGREAFIQQMNLMAEELHLQNSSFMNPSGLDAAAHYSSAFDLSLIARQVMQDEFLRSLVGTQQATVVTQSGTKQYFLYNTNLLLGIEPGVVGIKTGTTDLAGEALITQVNRDNHQVIIIALGSQDRYGDTKQIINWLFSHYQWLNF